jgi:DNA mismatch endonuclease (patch repair protein)
MRRIRSKNTQPERILREILRSLRYKFRSHFKGLPGHPDFVFPKRRKALFLHGCFWHFHGRCRIARIPKSRRDYWIPKLEGNKQRDRRNNTKLRYLGWRSLVIWECQLSNTENVKKRVKEFLGRRVDHL